MPVEGRWPGGEGLRGRGALPGHIGLRHGQLLDRPHRISGSPVEDEGEGLLGQEGDRWDLASVHDQVRQDRCRRRIVVPDAVVDRLKVPHPFAGGGFEGNDALRKQVVAEPVAAVEVAGPEFDREVDVSQFGVRAERGPHRRVAGILPGSVLPGLVPVFAGLRDGVEGPDQLARDGVVAANVSRRHLGRAGSAPGGQRGPHHHDVANHHRRGAGADRRPHQVQLPAQLEPQVHHPVFAEAAHRRPRRRVERHQVEPGTDHEDARRHPVRLPPRHTPPGVAPRRRTVPLVEAVGPQRLPGAGVDRHHGAPVTCRRVEDAVDHQRGRTVVVLRPGTVVVRLPPPHHLEVAHVVRVDLCERGIAGTARVATVMAPLSVGCAFLCSGLRGPQAKAQQRGQTGRRGRVRDGRAHGMTPGPDVDSRGRQRRVPCPRIVG